LKLRYAGEPRDRGYRGPLHICRFSTTTFVGLVSSVVSDGDCPDHDEMYTVAVVTTSEQYGARRYGV
jgi:hypothetical protein